MNKKESLKKKKRFKEIFDNQLIHERKNGNWHLFNIFSTFETMQRKGVLANYLVKALNEGYKIVCYDEGFGSFIIGYYEDD